MYVVQAVELTESPLEFWRRIGKDGGATLRSLARRVATEAGPFRTLLGFRQPMDRPCRTVTFDCEIRAFAEPGGVISVAWDAGLARLEGEVEVIPTRTAYQLRISASYDPPWAASLVADRSAVRRMAEGALRDFLRVVERPDPAATAADESARRRRRVLIEDEDPAWHRFIATIADGDEYDFDACQGPALVAGGCPILRGESCPKVDGADVILNSLADEAADNAMLLEALEQRWPEAAMTVLPGQPATYCLTRAV